MQGKQETGYHASLSRFLLIRIHRLLAFDDRVHFCEDKEQISLQVCRWIIANKKKKKPCRGQS